MTAIGNSAFANQTQLTQISIPSSVTSIGNFAFSDCIGLGLYGTVLTIPGSIKYISYSAFKGCFNLQKVSLSNGTTWIGDSAFENCTKLTEISVPDSLMIIGNSAFKNCTDLRTIDIPFSVTEIKDNSFYGCEKLTIHSKGSTKLPGWNNNWNSSNRPVIWGYEQSQWKTATNGALKANTPTKVNLEFYILTGCDDYDDASYDWYSFGEIELIDLIKFYYKGIQITVSTSNNKINVSGGSYYDSYRCYAIFNNWRIKSGTTVK